MIEFHESEHDKSTVSDCTLRAVALLFGKEAADKLLIRGNEHVGLDHHNSRCIVEVWCDSNGFRDGFIRPLTDEDVQAEDEEILTLSISGRGS
ncbi:hypothetical protein [Paenibacillus sp. L3-i20]|uniref:hypothetical protein n=1 Tax=Paenibacillus sp. L3-i20 TaxID=2905833 RepID=UPI001EE142D4|nr:hypothetical protein [Paenibacillus sp. L3-i20]GKU76836.1 hypothetical protein L3i20_v212330 [Paenibacillus sp. L3-i20]